MVLAASVGASLSVGNSPVNDTGLAALALALRIKGRPVDVCQRRHQFGRPDRPLNDTELLRAARQSGLKSRKISSQWESLRNIPSPGDCHLRDGRYCVVAAIRHQSGQEAILIGERLDAPPRSLPNTDFEAVWSGELIVVATRRLGGR